MKQILNTRSQIEELGKQLGLNTKQIHSILNNPTHMNEQFSLSQGPPMYNGGYYGTISIKDFNIPKKTTKK